MFFLTKNREIIITSLINSEGGLSSRQIQEKCNLSRKTLSVEMQELDRYLSAYGARIETIRGKGYAVKVLDEERYRSFCVEFLYENQRNRYLNFERNFLAFLVLFELATRDGYTSIGELSEQHHYSRSSVSKSLKTAKQYIETYRCRLISRPSYGIKMEGSEWNRRICLLFCKKIASMMGKHQEDAPARFDELFGLERFDLPAIVLATRSVLQQHKVYVPKIDKTKIDHYILLSQSRAAQYDQLAFSERQVERIQGTRYHAVGRALAEALEPKGIELREKDVLALSIMLCGYAQRRSVGELDRDQYNRCVQITHRFIGRLGELYGIGELYDEQFIEDFTCFLAQMQERVFFELPPDEECVYSVKQDGSFTMDICCDFGVLYRELCGETLPEVELLSAYFVISNAMLRNEVMRARFKAALVSQYGLQFSRNVAVRCKRAFGNNFSDIVPMEFDEANSANLSGYDLLITDIQQNRYDFSPIPIIRLDFYRRPHSHALHRFLSMKLAGELQNIVLEENIHRDNAFADKREVFDFLAERYVRKGERAAFVEGCLARDAMICGERGNRIAVVPSFDRHYRGEQMVLLLNRAPFQWKNEPVQMILFYNRRGRNVAEFQPLNASLNSMINGKVDVVDSVSRMSAEELRAYIVDATYPTTL